ncbi:MAG: sigma-54 dependent transcriptional regulator [Nitrospiraceae bacterium]|nr:sigma-54 dependent transcriptional regulator [Nitrospiraceae bacterium]
MDKLSATILVVDDDETLCDSLSRYLSTSKVQVFTVHTGAEALNFCSRRKTDIILLDQKLPDAHGYELCPALLNANEHVKIIFMTAFPSFDNALKAIKEGAYDYLSKPLELEDLRLTIRRAIRTIDLERVEQLANYKGNRESSEALLVGNSESFFEMERLVNLSAASDSPVLITGETGTGKNVVAKAIHYRSVTRNKSLFVSLNCASLPENLIEAELFGYEKGAFTGATSGRRGLFEMAGGGTIFLDEIGEMPHHLQSKLLGVLDEKVVKRLGGETAKHIDVRVIAATNLNIQKAMKEKKFREDLYYRLGVVRIHIAPLRERRDDIPSLCRHLVHTLSRGRAISISEEELAALKKYDWPGNIRELRNVIERAILLEEGEDISPSELLRDPFDRSPLLEGAARAVSTAQGEISTLRDLEREHIAMALERFSRNYSRTARKLGISLSTLKRKIREYGLA